jgi:uncharacterized repeat protein (TIGR03803 family)
MFASGPQETVLYSFQGPPDGLYPVGRLASDGAGNLYGAASQGGSGPPTCENGTCGTIFELTPPARSGGVWTETILHNFMGHSFGDGNSPWGGPIWGKGGKLYGTTQYGGDGSCLLLGSASGCGTVYELSPPATKGGAWTEQIIYSFLGGSDGHFPMGELVFDKQGNLYGSTFFGGGLGTCNGFYGFCGTIFELSPPATQDGIWTEKVLYSFTGEADGALPNGGLILDGKGALYGTAQYGGNSGCTNPSGTGCGVVFKLTSPANQAGSWSQSVIYAFNPSVISSDGAVPMAGLIFDKAGNLYGTASGGGTSQTARYGVAFRLSPPKIVGNPWIEKSLYSFGNGRTGGFLTSGLILDSHGDLYGVANMAGTYFGGTAFTLKPPPSGDGGWTYAITYAFSGVPNAAGPDGPLTPGKDGLVYGPTFGGGTGTNCITGINGCGAVYSIAP